MELENPRILRAIRRDVARLYTILHERERELVASTAEKTG